MRHGYIVNSEAAIERKNQRISAKLPSETIIGDSGTSMPTFQMKAYPSYLHSRAGTHAVPVHESNKKSNRQPI